ncbi:hypothetical protein MGAST_29480 [Mycobacterium gastri 'Wayne']|nr:hypothetical protein MGAST_29480 [Mycobacterium gastri 'Wayne']
MFAAGAEQRLSHGQAHQLGVGRLLRPSRAPPVGVHHVVIDRHRQFGQQGIEVCFHNCPSVSFSHILHKPARRECNHGGTARRVAAASTHSAQPVHTR